MEYFSLNDYEEISELQLDDKSTKQPINQTNPVSSSKVLNGVDSDLEMKSHYEMLKIEENTVPRTKKVNFLNF